MISVSASELPQDSLKCSIQELEYLRHAFRRACYENPLIAATEAQRYSLAQAIVSRYHPGKSETELINLALWKAL